MHTHRISRGVQVGREEPIVEYTDYTDEVSLSVDETIPVGPEGAFTILNYALVRSRITSFFLVCSLDAEWEVTEGVFISLKANVPFVWTRDGASGYDAIPWGADLTNITLTNSSSIVEATIKVRALMSSR